MKNTKLILLAIIFIYQSPSLASWVHCYNSEKNRIYFEPLTNSPQPQKHCQGRAYYQGERAHNLIEELYNDQGHPVGVEGTAKVLRLAQDRQILITQWNNPSQVNEIRVLEPDFDNNQVEVLCSLSNRGSHFSYKVKGNKLIIVAQKRKPGRGNQVQKFRKSCPLN